MLDAPDCFFDFFFLGCHNNKMRFGCRHPVAPAWIFPIRGARLYQTSRNNPIKSWKKKGPLLPHQQEYLPEMHDLTDAAGRKEVQPPSTPPFGIICRSRVVVLEIHPILSFSDGYQIWTCFSKPPQVLESTVSSSLFKRINIARGSSRIPAATRALSKTCSATLAANATSLIRMEFS